MPLGSCKFLQTEWRDPLVFWNGNAQEYMIILGARKPDGNKIRTGRTVFFTSSDFKTWNFKGNLESPNPFFVHEMPAIFQIGDIWYLLTTEYSNKNKTIYRISKSLDRPWTAPLDDAFDSRAYYAARSWSDGNKRYLFGWVPTKEGNGNWQWGRTLVVHETYQREDSTLGAKPQQDKHLQSMLSMASSW